MLTLRTYPLWRLCTVWAGYTVTVGPTQAFITLAERTGGCDCVSWQDHIFPSTDNRGDQPYQRQVSSGLLFYPQARKGAAPFSTPTERADVPLQK